MSLRIAGVLFAGLAGTQASGVPTDAGQAGADCPAVADTLVLDDVAAIRAAIDASAPGTVIRIPAGVYRLSAPLVIELQAGLEVRGAGAGATILELDGARAGFELRDNIRDITIADLTIRGIPGTFDDSLRVTGIWTDDRVFNRAQRNLRFTGLALHDLNNGIIVGTSCVPHLGCEGGVDSILIANNRLWNIRGTVSGIGYGIENSNGTNVRIVHNVLERTGRHAIYQATAYAPRANVVIADNVVIDHGQGTDGILGNIAITVARSSGVIVARNTVINSRNYALSIECDESDPGRAIEHVALLDNAVLGNNQPDLYVTALGRFASWRNRYVHAGDTPADTIVHIIHSVCGAGVRALEPPPLAELADLIARAGGTTGAAPYHYEIHDSVLHRVDPVTRDRHPLGQTHWTAVDALAGRGDDVFIADDGRLFRVQPDPWTVLADATGHDWRGTRGLAVGHDALYVVQGHCIYRVALDLSDARPWRCD